MSRVGKKRILEPKQVICPKRFDCENSKTCRHNQYHARSKTQCVQGRSCPACTEAPLSPEYSRDIANILNEELMITPYAKAALRLKAVGVTSDMMWWFAKSKERAGMPDPWMDNTYNQLRDLERGLKPMKDRLL